MRLFALLVLSLALTGTPVAVTAMPVAAAAAADAASPAGHDMRHHAADDEAGIDAHHGAAARADMPLPAHDHPSCCVGSACMSLSLVSEPAAFPPVLAPPLPGIRRGAPISGRADAPVPPPPRG